MSERYSRSEKSLSTLTVKFVEMMKAGKGAPLDLNIATKTLEVAKKRRIYDITNVLEGVNLIQKIEKNLYVWRGRNSDDEIDNKRLDSKLKEKKELEEAERQLTQDISSMEVTLAALLHSKSYAYLARNDFIKAFGPNQSTIIAKDVKKIFVDEEDRNSPVPFLMLASQVHQPLKLQILNNDNVRNKRKLACNLLCHEKLASECKKMKPNNPESAYKNKQIKRIALFRRQTRTKKFLEYDVKEKEELAQTVLYRDKTKEKSQFYVNKQQHLINSDDYSSPDFIDILHPVDIDYYNSYSLESASVHDLFDLDAEPLINDMYMETEYVTTYTDEEHLDDE